MADKAGPPNPLKPPENDLANELRLVGLLLALGAMYVLYQYVLKPQMNPAQPQPQSQAQQQPAPAQPAGTPAQTPANPAATPDGATGVKAASKEETFVVNTDVALVTFSNRGAVVKSWMLKKYCVKCCESKGNLLDVVNKDGAGIVAAPMSFEFRNQKPPVDLNQALFVATRGDDGKSLTFEYASNGVVAKKTFALKDGTYQTGVTSEVFQNGTPVPHLLAWSGGFGDSTVHKAWTQQKSVYWDPAKSQLILTTADDTKDGPVSYRGQAPFAGIADQYFAAAALPAKDQSIEVLTFNNSFKPEGETDDQRHVGVAVGGDGTNKFSWYVGPKDLDILRSVHPEFEEVVDWGRWFGFLARPLFKVLHWTYHNVVQNWGWAIVLVTVVINLALMPLKITSLKSAKKMQALQPEVDKINAKYKNISVKDPRKAEQQTEMMELYKKHGVNPLGGCLPMAMQLPFFFAFYTVLTVVSDLRGADWLWVCDLSRPEAMAIRALPILMLATQFWMQKMTPPSPGMDPTQQKMLMIMPLGMSFIFWYQSSGLVLYWLTGNLVGIVQQWLTNRFMPTPVMQPAATDPAKKKKK